MAQTLEFNDIAREKLLIGLNKVADAVGSTLGPKGRNVAIEKRLMSPLVVHDGVTVARSIELQDPYENMGARLIQDAAQKTNDTAGDGTTTATVLAQAIANEGMRLISAGYNPKELVDSINLDLEHLLIELDKLKRSVKTNEEIKQVATISSTNSDLGTMVADAIMKVGPDGVVTTEESSSFETTVEYKEGMEIDRGYLSPYFVTDDNTLRAVLEDPYILITDMKISHDYELFPFLEKFIALGHKKIVIIGLTVDGEAMSGLVVNQLRGAIQSLAIAAPSWGGDRLDQLEDIATLTGGKLITQDSGRELSSVLLEELGRCEKVTSDREKTIFSGGKGSKQAIKRRVTDLKSQITFALSDFEKDLKKKRLAKLSGGVAVINVGGATDVVVKEKKERVIDAVNATRAAIDDGIVAGGEITLRTLSAKAQDPILKMALVEPFKKLITNSGADYSEALVKMVGSEYPKGVDTSDGQVKDLIKAGIIDPVKVTKNALINAVSVATMIMTCSCLIADERLGELK